MKEKSCATTECMDTYKHLSQEGKAFYRDGAKERGITTKEFFLECCIRDKAITEVNSGKKTTLALAESITKMAEATEELFKKGFNRKLLILYIQNKTKLSQGNINAVLEAVEEFIDETKHQEQ